MSTPPTLTEKQLGRLAMRAIDRALRPYEEAARCDRGFDGGEWSGPAWSDAIAEKADDIIRQLAEKLGLPMKTVDHAINLYLWHGR